MTTHPPHPPTEGPAAAGPVAEHTLETVMTDHRFETHEPVALYVELGSGQIDVTKQ